MKKKQMVNFCDSPTCASTATFCGNGINYCEFCVPKKFAMDSYRLVQYSPTENKEVPNYLRCPHPNCGMPIIPEMPLFQYCEVHIPNIYKKYYRIDLSTETVPVNC